MSEPDDAAQPAKVVLNTSKTTWKLPEDLPIKTAAAMVDSILQKGKTTWKLPSEDYPIKTAAAALVDSILQEGKTGFAVRGTGNVAADGTISDFQPDSVNVVHNAWDIQCDSHGDPITESVATKKQNLLSTATTTKVQQPLLPPKPENLRATVQAAMEKALAGLQDKVGFSEITSFIPTWEYFYPCMPVRLLAIEAVEKYGNHICSQELPAHLQGFPYHCETTWWIEWYDQEKQCGQREYYGCATRNPYPDAEILTSWPAGATVQESNTWHINDPTYMIMVNTKITLPTPVEYIQLDIVLTPDGAVINPSNEAKS